jgi:hypothetical protein
MRERARSLRRERNQGSKKGSGATAVSGVSGGEETRWGWAEEVGGKAGAVMTGGHFILWDREEFGTSSASHCYCNSYMLVT